MAAARNMIGAGVRKLIERGLEVDGRNASLADIDRLTDDFIDYYAAHIADASRPFDGLEATLDMLAAQGFRFAVCTNKLEWLSKLLLDQLDLTPRFAAICGGDTFGVSKPDPAILQQTVARAGGELSGGHHGRRRRPGRRCRAPRRHSRDRGRIRLHRRADRGAQPGPGDRTFQ